MRLLKTKDNFFSTGHQERADVAQLLPLLQLPEWKRLVSKINDLQTVRDFKSLCLISHDVSEGKSLVASLLAIGYVSLLGKQVLLVKAEEQPENSTIFHETIMSGNSRNPSATLDLVSTASANGFKGDVCSEFSLAKYIDKARDLYDLIIIDTCSFKQLGNDMLDPIVLAAESDAISIIASRRSFSNEVIEHTSSLLKTHGLSNKLIGIIHNEGAPR